VDTSRGAGLIWPLWWIEEPLAVKSSNQQLLRLSGRKLVAVLVAAVRKGMTAKEGSAWTIEDWVEAWCVR
jgi:hypothetical protein